MIFFAHEMRTDQGRWLIIRDNDGEARAWIDTTDCEHCTDDKICSHHQSNVAAVEKRITDYDSWQGFTMSSVTLMKHMLNRKPIPQENKCSS